MFSSQKTHVRCVNTTPAGIADDVEAEEDEDEGSVLTGPCAMSNGTLPGLKAKSSLRTTSPAGGKLHRAHTPAGPSLTTASVTTFGRKTTCGQEPGPTLRDDVVLHDKNMWPFAVRLSCIKPQHLPSNAQGATGTRLEPRETPLASTQPDAKLHILHGIFTRRSLPAPSETCTSLWCSAGGSLKHFGHRF